MLLMKDFGVLCFTNEFLIEDNELKYLDYSEKDKCIRSEKIKDVYNTEMVVNNESEIMVQKSIDNKTLHRFNNNSEPEIFHFGNSTKICSINKFSITLQYNNLDFMLNFSRDKKVVYYKDSNYCTIYRIDDKEYKNVLESYQFIDNGYVYINYSLNKYEKVLLDKIYKFDLFRKSDSSCIILNKLPTRINILDLSTEKETNIKIQYTTNNIICNISSDLFKDNLVRYEENQDDINNIYESYSLHPLLFDPFNYHYIDEPLKYWVLENYINNNGLEKFERKVYEIDGSKLSDLINEINFNLDKPILVDSYEEF